MEKITKDLIKDLICEAIRDKEESQRFGVFCVGGPIGTNKKDEPIWIFDKEQDAKEKSSRMNKTLSPGEKSFYKMKYVVRKIK